MIVLKATQEKLLSVLQSVAGIVEKRHSLPILANVLVRKTRISFPARDLEIQIRSAASNSDEFAEIVAAVVAHSPEREPSLADVAPKEMRELTTCRRRYRNSGSEWRLLKDRGTRRKRQMP